MDPIVIQLRSNLELNLDIATFWTYVWILRHSERTCESYDILNVRVNLTTF